MLYIFPIVEGHGDERALPVLIRHILNVRFNYFEYCVLHPYRLPKGKIQQKDAWDAVISLASERLLGMANSEHDVLLILATCDADDDCPVELKQILDDFSNTRAERILFEFVAPQPEYETWFLAAAHSFAGHKDCVDVIQPIQNLNAIRDAKGHFERHILKENRYYSETVDQAKFSAIIDFSLNPETECRSFRRFIDVFERIIS